MKIFEKLPFIPKRKPVLTSRPVFQFSSSFIDSDYDEVDLKKQAARDYNKSRQIDIEGKDVHSSGPRSRTLLVLHVLSTVLSIISLSLFIAVIPMWDANFQHIHSIASGDYTDGLVLAPLLLSLFGSLFFFATEFLRAFSPTSRLDTATSTSRLNRQRSYLLLLSFTIIIILLPTLILSATNSIALIWQPDSQSQTGQDKSVFQCNLANILTPQCQPLVYTIGSLQIGGIVTGALVWLLWLALFTRGIFELIRARKEKTERRRRRREEREARRNKDGHSHHHHRHGRRKDHRGGSRTGHSSRSRNEKRGSDHDISTRSENIERPRPALHRADSGSRDRKLNNMKMAKDVVTVSRHQVESPAVRLASHKVRPKQKMQVWLANRPA